MSPTSILRFLPTRHPALPGVLASFLLLGAGPALAQDTCGLAGGYFQVDGQFFSSGSAVDWAQGLSGQGVLDDLGNPVLTPALHDRDEHWAGNASDPDAFSGTANKNNDPIDTSPWTWGSGSGPAKNDLTDVYAHSAMVDGDLWLFLGATTRSNNGSSHIDFEFNQQGFTRTGTTSGTIIGNGADGGRTRDVDFIVSVDYTEGGNVPVASFRIWRQVGDHFEFLLATPDPGEVFICTNETTIPSPPWGSVDPDGSVNGHLLPYQMVEMGLNLTGLGIDPRVFCTDVSTLLFKTRSSASFTAELKDLALYQFSIVAPPACTITAERSALCAGESTQLCAPEPAPGADLSYVWSGPGGPYPDARCILVDEAGTYSLVVTDNRTGCSSEGCSFDLTVNELPVCSITADRTTVCDGETASFCGPVPPAGSDYRYEWSGPGGPHPDVRCLEVSLPGTYSLTVVNETSGCVGDVCQETLIVNPLPSADISGPSLLCEGASGQLCGPEGNFGYAWTGPAGGLGSERCITVSQPGRYTLVVTNLATGCRSLPGIHDVLVAGNPGCEITGPASICPGTEIELCGPEGEFNYTWSGPGGPFPNARCIDVTAPGTYRVRVDDSNGCVSECEHTVTLDEPVVAGELSDVFLCTGERAEFCVTATGTGPLTFQWFKDGSAIEGATGSCLVLPSIEAGDEGHYTVTVAGKCNEVTRGADLQLADVSVAELGDRYLCLGQRAELCAEVSGRGPFTYVWTRDGVVLPEETDSCLVIEAVSETDEAEYCVTVQGFCGDPVTQCSRIYVGECVEYCGLTQGFYGNAGGKWNGLTTYELLDSLITPSAPLVLGVPGVRSLSFPEGTEYCIITLLPGGGTAMPLPQNLGDATIDPVSCDVEAGIRAGRGRIRNILLAQAITLSLNVRLDPNLPDLPLCRLVIMIPILPGPDGIRGTEDDIPDNEHARIVEIPESVFEALDELGLSHTAGGALELANLALGGALPPSLAVSPADIAGTLGSINDVVDECALTIHCENPVASESSRTDDGRHYADPSDGAANVRGLGVTLLTANPLRSASQLRFEVSLAEPSQVEAAVYSVSGRLVSQLGDRTLEAGDHGLEIDLQGRGPLPSGIYFLRLQARGAETGRSLAVSRKLVFIQ